MQRRAPTQGDFVVEYRPASRPRGSGRVAVVHLTPDAGPEELFSSNATGAGDRAEGLAALWALQDGCSAWRVVRTLAGDDVAEPIGVVAYLRSSPAPRSFSQ